MAVAFNPPNQPGGNPLNPVVIWVQNLISALTATFNSIPAASPISNSLGADVALNNVANYFDGPSVAQGSLGTWWAAGTVTLTDTAGAANFALKLWDGTTVIDSAHGRTETNIDFITVSLSGFIVAPAGNLRISVKDLTSTSGVMQANGSGNAKDSTVTAFRIA